MFDPTDLSAEEFDAAMAAVGPFEACPHLAIAVSGGPDSMALCLLAQKWAVARGGNVSALTVDHGLRSGSQAEAMRVGRWLTERGIEHHVLPWIGKKPTAGIQAAARSARYRLMSQWCAERGILHVLLGHHEHDQAETVLMRQSRGSGVSGLAGMGVILETAAVRLIRPLLKTPPSRLRSLLTAVGQPWIEDPSNTDPAHARSRIRSALPHLVESEDAVPMVIQTSAAMARARMALKAAASTLLARCCHLFAEGYARFNAPIMASAPIEVSTPALGGLLTAIGGCPHAPATEKLERVVLRLVKRRSLAAATLGRCRLVRTGDSVLVCREGRGLPAPQTPPAAGPVNWDGRFLMDFAWSPAGQAGDIRLVALGADGAHRAGAGGHSSGRAWRVPREVRAALPALRDDEGVLVVPHLGYERSDASKLPVRFRSLSFRPGRQLTESGQYLA